MLLFMIGTTIAAYVCSDKSHFGTQVGPVKGDVPLAEFSNLVLVLQVCAFSTAFHFAVPGIMAETKNKQSMVSVMSASVLYIYITNLILSVLMAFSFGFNTHASSNLNWVHYIMVGRGTART
jgi:hypothetical protein